MTSPTSGHSLRPGTPEDIAPIAEIEKRIHVAPWSEENFRTELEKPYSTMLLMTDDETDSVIAGYIVYWVMFGEYQILNVAVDLPFRGKGFAKAMIRRVVSVAAKQEIRKIVLDVRKSNIAAIQLYQRLNFSITHMRKGFYSNGEDAYQMTLAVESDGLPQI